MQRWHLRKAGPEDATLLSRLKVATFRLNYRDILPPDMLSRLGPDDPHVGIAKWRRTLTDPSCETWVVETGEPAGFVSLTPPPAAIPQARRFLDQIYLLPAWQSGGMGGAIWRHTVEHMRAAQATPFALSAFEGNDPARRFYVRRGGRILGHLHSFDWLGTPFYEIVYLFEEG